MFKSLLARYHISRHKRDKLVDSPLPHNDPTKKVFDKLVLGAAVFGPVMNLPQLFQIISTHSSDGVSWLSWISFALVSGVWLSYGIIHKDKPLIFTNGALVVLQTCIATSALLYR